jgi:hypothetical protein
MNVRRAENRTQPRAWDFRCHGVLAQLPSNRVEATTEV